MYNILNDIVKFVYLNGKSTGDFRFRRNFKIYDLGHYFRKIEIEKKTDFFNKQFQERQEKR